MFKLVKPTDPILKRKTEKFDFDNPSHNPVELAENMLAFMKDGAGIGLAAPQIGLPLRIFVMSAGGEEIVCINPVIVAPSEKVEIAQEGCLSFPDLKLKIKRPVEVIVKYQVQDGTEIEHTFYDLAARCFQHELDHLDGTLFTKKVPTLSLQLANNQRLKRAKQRKRGKK